MLMESKGALIAFSIFMVVGAFLSKSAQAECREGEESRTTTGAVFTCDTTHFLLGEAWRDPRRLIWGDSVKMADGTIHRMNHHDATNYCASIGARLPSKKEFTLLREDMMDRVGTYKFFNPQILPNLFDWFWSSSVNPNNTDFGYAFLASGDILLDNRSHHAAVRCVVSR